MRLIDRLMRVPWAQGRRDWAGADCWGLVELWYAERFGLALCDRDAMEQSPLGVMAAVQITSEWVKVDRPRDDDVIVMRAQFGGQVIEHGHVGVFWRGSVLHTAQAHGAVCQPWTARHVKCRVTAILRHRSLA